MEGIESDARIVSDLGEGDGEMKIIMESTKIGEEKINETGSGEEMKGREARIAGEECGRVTIGSSAWPLFSSDKLKVSSPLAFIFKLLFLCYVLRLIFLIEWLIL